MFLGVLLCKRTAVLTLIYFILYQIIKKKSDWNWFENKSDKLYPILVVDFGIQKVKYNCMTIRNGGK